tara:strand:+ start:411 stop:701 length:291 start_codon:yes stop_codon:yes gene_type:complete
MKKSQLQKIIREEISKIQEQYGDVYVVLQSRINPNAEWKDTRREKYGDMKHREDHVIRYKQLIATWKNEKGDYGKDTQYRIVTDKDGKIFGGHNIY